MKTPPDQAHPAVCDYEGSRYRTDFWEKQDRQYEDLAERIALRKLLPPRGTRLVEIGAGFGRLASLYENYEEVVLLDYAVSMLREAKARLGDDPRIIYVAADVYLLPFVEQLFDTVVMVRVMHHLQDVPRALREIRRILAGNGVFICEYANKRNLKAIGRYLLRRQHWSPFALKPYEFATLNFDFHPRWMSARFREVGLYPEQELAVSHFRLPFLKRLIPPATLARLDGAFQEVGARWKLTPSVFVRNRVSATADDTLPTGFFRCPLCGDSALRGHNSVLVCTNGHRWPVDDGIYIFKPMTQ
ncbi:MAG TPA: class I SAM-dependent methyltransferase [Anaerolineae bacterium]|nr:class I SAM-dependent methyltransferase [Anaerolineae bacterium]